jgi:hypothetical protein
LRPTREPRLEGWGKPRGVVHGVRDAAMERHALIPPRGNGYVRSSPPHNADLAWTPPSHERHARECGNPFLTLEQAVAWVPAFAGTTAYCLAGHREQVIARTFAPLMSSRLRGNDVADWPLSREAFARTHGARQVPGFAPIIRAAPSFCFIVRLYREASSHFSNAPQAAVNRQP